MKSLKGEEAMDYVSTLGSTKCPPQIPHWKDDMIIHTTIPSKWPFFPNQHILTPEQISIFDAQHLKATKDYFLNTWFCYDEQEDHLLMSYMYHKNEYKNSM